MRAAASRRGARVTRRPVIWWAWAAAAAAHLGVIGAFSLVDVPRQEQGEAPRTTVFDVTLSRARAPALSDDAEELAGRVSAATPEPQARSRVDTEARPQPATQAKPEAAAKAAARAEPKPEAAVKAEPKARPDAKPPAEARQAPRSERSAPAAASRTAPSAGELLSQATAQARSQTFGMQPENYARAPMNGAERAAVNRYIASWTQGVERYGNQFYNGPSGLQGTLRIRAVILRSGQLESVEVIQSSGHPELDQAALTTVREAAPFRPFDAGMGDRERLVITRSWRYGQGNSFGVQ